MMPLAPVWIPPDAWDALEALAAKAGKAAREIHTEAIVAGAKALSRGPPA